MADTTFRPLVHIRVDGRSEELTLAALDLTAAAADAQVKQAVARYLKRAIDDLKDYVVVRTSAAIIVRPEAIYG